MLQAWLYLIRLTELLCQANLQCDFTEEMWNSSTPSMLAVTNWSGEPLVIEQGTTMGIIEEVEFCIWL